MERVVETGDTIACGSNPHRPIGRRSRWQSTTATRTGLNAKCEVDAASYPAGVKVSDDDMAMLHLTPHEFHGERNYTIAPKPA